MPAAFGDFHRLVNGGMRRNAVQIQQLISAEPQQLMHPALQLANPFCHKAVQPIIKRRLPADSSIYKLRG
ncbi:hypothetical protein D3C78_1701890 [compost metagenome]